MDAIASLWMPFWHGEAVIWRGRWRFIHPLHFWQIVSQNYWVWPVVDFWFLGNERGGTVLNFFW